MSIMIVLAFDPVREHSEGIERCIWKFQKEAAVLGLMGLGGLMDALQHRVPLLDASALE
jgi:hypothetical protein